MSEFSELGHRATSGKVTDTIDRRPEDGINLGLFNIRVKIHDGSSNIISQKGVRKEDRFIELHFPELAEDDRQNLRERARESMSKLTEYIKAQHLENTLIVGATRNEKLANVSRHFGFSVEDKIVPIESRFGLQNEYLLDNFLPREEMKQPRFFGKIRQRLQPKSDSPIYFISQQAGKLLEAKSV